MSDVNRQSVVATTALLAVVLVVVHVGFAVVDPELRFFMGDSESYFHAAITEWIPPDRSWLYPLLMRWLVLPWHTPLALLIVQSLASIAAALMAFGVLARSFRLDIRIAALAAFLVGMGPELVFYERMMMAESFGMLALACMLAVGFAYLRRGNWLWLPALAALSLVVVCLRMSLLPVALCFVVLPPLVRWIGVGERSLRAVLVVVGHVILVCLVTATLHLSYQHLYGRLTSSEPAYIANGGTFRLTLLLPLVEPEDLVGTNLPATFFERFPAAAIPRERETQLWSEAGAITAMTNELGIAGRERAAQQISAHILRRDPLGVALLGWQTTQDYFDAAIAGPRMQDDVGTVPVSPNMVLDLRQNLGYSGNGQPDLGSPTARYFAASGGWLTFCLFALAPLAVLMLLLNWRVRERRPALLLLASTAIGLVAGQVLFSHIVSFRYLLPFPFFFWLCASATIAGWPGKKRFVSSVDPVKA